MATPLISVREMVFSPRRAALSVRNLGRRVVAEILDEILAEIWVAVWWPKFWAFGSAKKHFTH